MIKILKNSDEELNDWSKQFYQDFKKRFASLLSFDFRQLPLNLCLGVMDPRLSTSENEQYIQITKEEVKNLINLYDLKRMESYGKNLVDYHLVLDLLPIIANLYFLNRLKSTYYYNYNLI
jgi:N-acetyltransferase 10